LGQLYDDLNENVLIISEIKVSALITLPAAKFDIDLQG